MREPGSANDVSVVYSKIMAHTSSLIINLQAFSCFFFFFTSAVQRRLPECKRKCWRQCNLYSNPVTFITDKRGVTINSYFTQPAFGLKMSGYSLLFLSLVIFIKDSETLSSQDRCHGDASSNSKLELDIAKLLDFSSKLRSVSDTLYNEHVTLVFSVVTSVGVPGKALNTFDKIDNNPFRYTSTFMK